MAVFLQPPYKTIEELVLKKYFPTFLYEYQTGVADKQQLQIKNDEQERQIVALEEKVRELEAQIQELSKNEA